MSDADTVSLSAHLSAFVQWSHVFGFSCAWLFDLDPVMVVPMLRSFTPCTDTYSASGWLLHHKSGSKYGVYRGADLIGAFRQPLQPDGPYELPSRGCHLWCLPFVHNRDLGEQGSYPDAYEAL